MKVMRYEPFPDNSAPEGWPVEYVAASDYGALAARCAELEACLRLFSIQCEELGHDKGQFHDYATPCPVVARVRAALADGGVE